MKKVFAGRRADTGARAGVTILQTRNRVIFAISRDIYVSSPSNRDRAIRRCRFTGNVAVFPG